MTTNYLNDLNEAQREAVVNIDSPCMIIAGAGSGKTRVLTYRIVHLLQNNVPAYKIMALTFTNKAAREMKERIAQLVGPEKSRSIWMGTFHSIFARILRRESELLGYTPNFTIYDTTDSKNLLKSLVKERHLNIKEYNLNRVYSRISMAKNNLITPALYESNSDIVNSDNMTGIGDTYILYKLYMERCKTANAMDFDDLLLNMNILLRDSPEILKTYQNRFSYILVDEFQDTNFSQYRIVNLLSRQHRNICVVGDDAQSIYAFRGARIENIFKFRNDYSDHKIFKLEQNYRSSQTIVNAANSVIAYNTMQLPKNIFSNNEPGDKIELCEALTDVDEGFKVAEKIIADRQKLNINWSKIAILYRINSQSRVFEEALLKLNIPYRIYGSLTFYQRKEIKDSLAYFRMLVNQNDDQALLRTINYPTRGIGSTTLDKIGEVAANHRIPMWQVINSDLLDQLQIKPNTKAAIKRYVEFVHEMSIMEQTADAYECAMQVIKKSGLYQELIEDQTKEGTERIQNIEELFNGVRDFVAEQYSDTEETVRLSDYLESVALLTDFDKQATDNNKVSLMTVHSSKGLEFQSVYVVGLEEQLFPSAMVGQNIDEIEEERRLFYVAITRAQKKVTLTWVKQRVLRGLPETRRLSRFVKEIDPRYITQTTNNPNYANYPSIKGYSYTNNNFNFRRDLTTKSLSKPAQSPPHVQENQGIFIEHKTLDVGNKVLHPKFGAGIVQSVEGQGINTKAVIHFDTGAKTLLLRFARLQLLN